MSDDMKELKGKTINHVLMSDDDTVIVFSTDQGNIAYETEGDCCSSTWFDSVTGFDALLGQVINESEEIEMPDDDKHETKSEHCIEEMQSYGIQLKSDKGRVDIVYRNSSNGYYGGSINLVTSPKDLSKFKQLTDDWSA